MTLKEANVHFHSIANVPFVELFAEDTMSGIVRDKGRSGKLLERALGLANTTSNRDFEDGELKTNKCDANGKPLETIAITQISSHIDDLIAAVPFEETWVYEKISNMLYIPVCKDGAPHEWFFLPSIHINLQSDKYKAIMAQLKEDYEYICAEVKRACENGEMLSTINGKYIQIRTKDSTPYHPITSKTYGRVVSDKNRAFYFKKDFINAIKNLF
jgi:DNA mismatch repair protein MutH